MYVYWNCASEVKTLTFEKIYSTKLPAAEAERPIERLRYAEKKRDGGDGERWFIVNHLKVQRFCPKKEKVFEMPF